MRGATIALALLAACALAQEINKWTGVSQPTNTLGFREMHVAANVEGNLLVFGGSATNFSQALGDTWLYDYASQEFVSLSNVGSVNPAARLAAASAAFTMGNGSEAVLMYGGLPCLFCLMVADDQRNSSNKINSNFSDEKILK